MTKSLKEELDAMAHSILTAANGADGLADKVDAFKAVSAYFINTSKAGGKAPKKTGTTFGDLKDSIMNGTKEAHQ